MRIINATVAFVTLAVQLLSRTAFATAPENAIPLLWDPGLTHEGTRVVSNTATVSSNYLYRITTANPSLAAWRTALNVTSGEANLYLSKGVPPTIAKYDFKSDRPGSDGFVISSTQFAPNELWYILVEARAGASYTLVSGAPYVEDLGAVAADDSSSSGEVVVGPEGIRFFSAQAPNDMLAWRLWVNGKTNTIMLKKSGVPLPTSNAFDVSQAGQMLVVPPYLTGGQQYFIGIVGDPGTKITLDSRRQAIIDLAYGASTPSNDVTNFPYTTYRVQVPAQQIAWRLSIPSTNGNPNITLRRNSVPNETTNDALSEQPAPITDNISLVPPVLSDGTFYITIWATNRHQFVLNNGPATVTDINYIDTIVNDEPDRIGWRYYRVTDISQQLGSLGWMLSVSNSPNARIAIRRNAAPSIWTYKNPGLGAATYHDLISVAQTLQEPAHQADVWYIGVYTPTNALGAFTLRTRELDPGPQIPPWQTASYDRTNVTAGVWEYFRLDLPVGPHPGLGWDLRLQNVTGTPVLVVRRDAFPASLSSGGISFPVNVTNINPLSQWIAGPDWTGRSFSGTTNENGRFIAMPLDRPLQPGRYYVGVQSAAGSTQPISFTLLSRWIGQTMDIPVRTLAVSGAVHTNTLPPREAAYYAVQIPPNTPSFKARVRVLDGEVMAAVNQGVLPNSTAIPSLSVYGISAGKAIQKRGDEYINILPPRGSTYLTAGTYYIAVIGEGQNPADSTHIGAGNSTFVIETLGQMPETAIGTLADELVVNGSLVGGDSQAYHFNTTSDILGFWITIENAVGNPVPVSRGEIDLADPGLLQDLYGNDGGQIDGAVSGNPIKVRDPYPTETIMVKARASSGNYPDASYTLRVKAIKPAPLTFDGGVTNVAGADADHGVFFQIDVPSNAVGWDIRLTNVTAGFPRLVVCKDYIPTFLTTSPTLNFGQDTNWIPAEQFASGRDWTDKALSPDGLSEDGRIFAVGMGRPLEPGRYFVGVMGLTAGSMDFTLVSRGIGPGMSIPVTPLDFNGGTNRVQSLPAREAAYYSVDIPAGAPSWKVHLSANLGESLLIASQSTLPNFLALPTYNITNSCGHKMQKAGDEYFLLLPPPGTNVLTPGRYYLTVVSEGQQPTSTRIGTGSVDFTITSVGPSPIRNLGQLGATDVVDANTLGGGESQLYQFTVPAGTLGIEARLDERVSNPVMVLHGGATAGPAGASQNAVPQEYYGNENGAPSGIYVHPTLINVGDVTNTIYTLVVIARSINNTFTNTSYTLHLNASGTTTLAFDGGSFGVTNQGASTWKYFRVTVPADANGWDVRVQGVYGGSPRLVVRRESLPSTTVNSPWSSPSAATAWPTNAQWAPVTDWTRRSYSATNATLIEDGQIFACGMGRPLEPGNYFVGVYNGNATAPTAYTILSRGIGPEMSIPLIDIPFVGSYSGTLPGRDAVYFRVVVPSNSPSLKIKLTGDSGEAMMVALRGAIPNIDMTQNGGSLANGKAMQKPGNEHFILLPAQGQTNLPASTNYFAVISEGVNPPAANRIGVGSSSFTFESEGSAPFNQLGLVTSEDLVRPDRLQGGEVKVYQFLVPSGTLGFKIKLENREGNPAFVLRYGDKIPDPGSNIPNSDPYGNEGGYTSSDGNSVLFTAPNALPGVYTVAVKARPNANNTYTDAGYTLRVQEILVPELNFSAAQNTNGIPNVASGLLDDNERVFYKVIIPAGEDIAGWKLELIQSSGLATMRVRKDFLPSDASASTQMQFTSASAVIVPPYLTNGVWYVEVKGTGSTAFQLTSKPLTLERPVWSMPEPGKPITTPGLVAPLFGDTGVDTNGIALPDPSTFLEQGTLHYYAVSVPTNNYGVLRAVLEAVSGNPDLYLRSTAPPTLYHNAAGAAGTIYDRSMLQNATEYANWVPIDGKIEARLKPGLWYLAVRAAGNANTRYRLKLSVGNVTEIPVHGPLITNQLLAGSDWRYYKFTAPETMPGGFNVQFSEQSGDVVVYLRDTLPPGNGNTGLSSDYKDWNTDNKNQGVYLNYNTPGTYSFTAPPVRPGATYFIGVRAVTDAIFSIGVTTNGVPNEAVPTIPFYGGTVAFNLAPGGQTMYRIDVPAEATRWRHSSSHPLGVQFYIEQGTPPTKGGSDDWRSPSSANTSLNQYLIGPWPWNAGQSYYMIVTNTTAQAQDITFAMDGRNSVTDDNDNDLLPDAWELQYFGGTGSQIAAGDPDRDNVTNYDEYLEGTNPNDGQSYRARLTTGSIFGTIVRSPNLPTFELNSQVTLTPVPDPGYSFTGWLGSSNGLINPLVVTMDGHKSFTASFKLAGDDLATALPISGESATITSSNVGMTKEPGEPNHAGNPGGKSIWWRWTAISSKQVTLTTAGTPFNTLLGVYTGAKVSALTTIASDSNSGGVTNRSVVKFVPVVGQTYYIAVDGLNAASGRLTLSLSVSGTSSGIAPTFAEPTRLNGTAQIKLTGSANFSYSLDASTNLVDWVPLGTITTDASGAGSFSHTSSPNDHSFYRTRH